MESKLENSNTDLIERKRKKTFESSWYNKVQGDFSLLEWCETGTYCIWNYCIKFIICDKKAV